MTKKNEEILATARIPELRDRLANGTDALNKKIKELESSLAKLGLGVAASVRLDSDPFSASYLRFCKWGDAWRLVLVDELHDREEAEIEPLSNASRERRLLAVEHFSTLITELMSAAEREYHRINKATETTDTAIAFVKGLVP